ncbi:MBL fold metallo-hydrolase [Marinilabiliaceae bacterium ANBcel2]|nr:MBL fold metallo-hydrolase [Marinilabiliaceae bacterium ANBcel2]
MSSKKLLHPLKVVVLGTGTSLGVPMIACQCDVCKSSDNKDKRLRSSVLIEYCNINIVIDCGPDFRMQMLNANIGHIDAIVMTHSHKDHTGGLDDVRAFNWINRSAVNVYAEKNVIDSLNSQYPYVFGNSKYPGLPQVNLHKIDCSPFKIKGLDITPLRAMHHKLPVLGFRIGSFSYLTDVSFIPEETLNKMEGTSVLIIDALRKTSHISHFSLDEALDIVHQVNPDKAYFTHISHHMGLHKKINNELPQNAKLAYDGQVIIL